MKGRLLDIAWAAADLAALPRLMRHRHRRDVMVLMYHAVTDSENPCPRWTHVPESSFAWQLSFLQANYKILPLPTVLDAMRNGRELPRNTAVITFDDGLRSIYSRAFPLLRRMRMPATVFLTTGLIGTGSYMSSGRLFLAMRSTNKASLALHDFELPDFRLNGTAQRDAAVDLLRARLKRMPAARKTIILDAIEERLEVSPADYPDYADEFALLNWREIEEMHATGLIDFGAHGSHHEILTRLPAVQMEREVSDSVAEIRDRFGYRSPMFAYPNGQRGDFDDATKHVLRKVSAQCGLSTIEGFCRPGDDPFELRRIGIGNTVTKSRFAALCSGLETGSKRRLGRL